MTVFVMPRIYPPPVRWEDRIRNGKPVDWHVPRSSSHRGQFALAHCRKLLFHKTTNAASPPQGIAGTETPWRWHMRTGEGTQSGSTINVRAVGLMLPASNASSVDARFVVNIGATASGSGRYSFIDTSPTYDQLSEVEVLAVDLAPDTTYACSVDVIDYARLVSLTVYEEVVGAVDTAATYVTDISQFAHGAEITDAQHQELNTDLHQIWKHGGNHYFSLVPDVEGGFWTRTTNSYVNILDDTSTVVAANSPGYNCAAQYHNPQHTDNVTCVFAAYAAAAPAGSGNVRLANAGGTLATLTVNSATPAWYTGTVNLDGSAALDKVDVLFQGDGTNAITVEAVSLYARVA